MTTKDVKRKLRAILSADVQGYSRLMGDDEVATVKTITEYRETLTSLVNQYTGRVVDSPGDNVLAVFGSVVDAVQCAVEIQNILKAKNEDLPENRRMIFRIGVNLGDVIQEGDRIYGDGVNIAARIESLADGGGICISGTAYDHIENKLALGYNFMGKHSVKNIAKPIRVYKVPMDPKDVGKKRDGKSWKKMAIAAAIVLILGTVSFAVWNFYLRPPQIEPASVEKMAFPLPDKPSIAVLPFVNMSGDPEQDYFSDGLTEEIISALSRVPKLFVIARNSTFTYKGKPVKIQQVSEELGVRYVLEGSVRKAGDRVRITTQLIDAITGHHLWSERYDRDLKDIFTLQDEITMKIITALQVELTEGESVRFMAKGTHNLKAYLNNLRALEHIRGQTKEDNISARRLAEEAIALDPEYANSYSLLAATHMQDVWFKTTKSPKQSLTRAIELAQKAIALDDSLAYSHGLLGWLYTMIRQHDKAIAECKRAVALDPSGAVSHSWLSMALRYAGRYEEAVQMSEKAIRLNPFPPVTYFRNLSMAYIGAGRYGEAIAAGKKAVTCQPDDFLSHAILSAAYSFAGREEEARSSAAEVLRIYPKYHLKYIAKILPYKNKGDLERFIGALRKAGLPDKLPLPLPDKPSIAVLPFVNMSGDPEQEYFSDGITEEIITALSKTPKLFVIARTSSFKYKGKEIDIRTIGRELGVRYVLEGSVRKAGDKVRITAQLIDAKTNKHLWAERYDRDLKDIFSLQDEITKKVITALHVQLTEGEEAAIRVRSAGNLNAYLKFLQGREYLKAYNRAGNIKSRKLAEEIVDLDPTYSGGYVLLAAVEQFDVLLGLSKSPRESLARALQFAKKGIAIDDTPDARRTLARTYLFMRKHEAAIAEAERALELEPNCADSYASLASTLCFADRPQEALPLLERAIRLNPYPQQWYFRTLSLIGSSPN